MRQFLLVVALLVALGSTALSAEPLSDAERDAAVTAHNDVRRRVAEEEGRRLGGTVSIPDLTWDSTAAAVAQDWADSLIKENPPKSCHRCGTARCDPPLVLDQCEPGLGENIRNQWSLPGVPDLSPREAVSWWASEKQWYNFDSNTCAPPPGETCGHYTQVVWSSTRGVGCGRAQRTTEDADGKKKNWVFWVCDYTPGVISPSTASSRSRTAWGLLEGKPEGTTQLATSSKFASHTCVSMTATKLANAIETLCVVLVTNRKNYCWIM